MRKRAWFGLSALILVVLLRIALPFLIRSGLNFYLKDHVKGYTGHAREVGLSFYRSSFQIEGFELSKIQGGRTEPFILVKTSDFHIDPLSVIQKRVIGQATLAGVSYSFLKMPEEKPDGDKGSAAPAQSQNERSPKTNSVANAPSTKWEWTCDDLQIDDSEIHYVDVVTRPRIDIWIDDVSVHATNLTSIEHADVALETHVHAHAKFKKTGVLNLTGGINLQKKPVSFDYDFSAKQMSLAGFNELFSTSDGLQFAAGTLDVYSELASLDNKVKGYAKPFFSHVQIANADAYLKSLKEKKQKAMAFVIEAILHDSENKDVAAKIPIEGTLDHIHVDWWEAARTSLANAFSTPISKALDHDIDIDSVQH